MMKKYEVHPMSRRKDHMKKMTAKRLKSMAKNLGADLCGIAPVERFKDAPQGFGPRDIFSGTRSVVVLAKRFPEGAFYSASPVPYTFASETILHEVFRLTCRLSLDLQDAGVIAVPIPSEPYEYWDADAKEGKGILSLKHAGYMAGLGVMGKNTLLTNDVFGNRITIGAMLLDEALDEDPIARYMFCSGKCSLCVDNCPGKALDGSRVIQKNCREKSIVTTLKGYTLETCHACRGNCPGGRGIGDIT
jgi:epoxyqueuosine reductase QueG